MGKSATNLSVETTSAALRVAAAEPDSFEIICLVSTLERRHMKMHPLYETTMSRLKPLEIMC